MKRQWGARLPTVTLAHYERHADEFRGGTRDDYVSENIAWLLITAAPPQQLSRFGRIHTEVFYGKKPIALDIA